MIERRTKAEFDAVPLLVPAANRKDQVSQSRVGGLEHRLREDPDAAISTPVTIALEQISLPVRGDSPRMAFCTFCGPTIRSPVPRILDMNMHPFLQLSAKSCR